MKNLNLGCGQFPKENYINVDNDPAAKADIYHDLSVQPYPFESESFDQIVMSHILEHLPNTMDVMRELNRLLKPGAFLTIKVPHFSRGFTHWDHKRGFDVSFPYYFNKSFPGYTGLELIIESTRIRWFAQPYLKKVTLSPFAYKTGFCLGCFFDLIGNINLFFTSRILCFWVGGYEEIEFIFKKPNNDKN
ncbi:MAG: methyltransferase domain-containing protein [Methylococcaceae bacterium]